MSDEKKPASEKQSNQQQRDSSNRQAAGTPRDSARTEPAATEQRNQQQRDNSNRQADVQLGQHKQDKQERPHSPQEDDIDRQRPASEEQSNQQQRDNSNRQAVAQLGQHKQDKEERLILDVNGELDLGGDHVLILDSLVGQDTSAEERLVLEFSHEISGNIGLGGYVREGISRRIGPGEDDTNAVFGSAAATWNTTPGASETTNFAVYVDGSEGMYWIRVEVGEFLVGRLGFGVSAEAVRDADIADWLEPDGPIIGLELGVGAGAGAAPFNLQFEEPELAVTIEAEPPDNSTERPSEQSDKIYGIARVIDLMVQRLVSDYQAMNSVEVIPTEAPYILAIIHGMTTGLSFEDRANLRAALVGYGYGGDDVLNSLVPLLPPQNASQETIRPSQ